MASIPYIFSWDVISAPLDEAEIERSQAFARVCLGNYFNLTVHVKHQIISLTHPCPQPPTAKPTFSPFFSSDRSIILSSSQLFENGPSYMRVHFPHPIIPRELMVQMMPEVITYAENMLEKNYSPSSGLHYERGNFRLFKLVLNILVQKPYDEIYNMILEDSASLNATVESLDGVNLGGVAAAKERCSICLVEFSDGMQVSALPCTHKYHQECINVWLETSYTCPLCRQPLVKLNRRDQRATGDLKPVRMKKWSEI